MTNPNVFQNITTRSDNKNVWNFSLQPTHVAYANTLRRLILTGVETVAFRADMTENGSTSDVIITKNTTPMTNEMLAHRIGLLPIYVPEPLNYKSEQYSFKLEQRNETDTSKDVTCSDIIVFENHEDGSEPSRVVTEKFFPLNTLTKDTCLITTFKPTIYGNMSAESVSFTAKATIGTGQENARFMPVSQCSYVYTPDKDIEKMKTIYEKWLINHKKVSPETLKEDPTSVKAISLEREFNTMEAAKCFLTDDKGEPYSFDFTIETIGILTIPYIVQRACEVGETLCQKYTSIHDTSIDTVSIQPADTRIRGFDFMFTGEDHTLGNLFQTWIEQNLVGKGVVTFAGYKIPHPLRAEMLLRIGVDDGKESSARSAIAEAARGCSGMFRSWRTQWSEVMKSLQVPISGRTIKIKR